MPALNFKPQFAPLVESGAKRQTIRAPRRDGRDPKAGDVLYLYAGQQTKECRKLAQAMCISSNTIGITENSFSIAYKEIGSDCPKIVKETDIYLLDEFARADGFADWAEMRDWFASVHGLPFVGYLIRW